MALGLCSLWHAGSLVEARGLSCPKACGILVPQPGIEPTSPALEGRFFTTGLPGKSPKMVIFSNSDPSSKSCFFSEAFPCHINSVWSLPPCHVLFWYLPCNNSSNNNNRRRSRELLTLIFFKQLIYMKHCGKYITRIILFNPHNCPMSHLLFTLYR